MTKKTDSHPAVIGWREWVGLPELGVRAIKAKVDTGARSSSLHAHELEEFERGGIRMVRFGIYPVQRKDDGVVTVEARLLEHRRVRSSSGKAELRPVIVTNIVLLDQTWPIEVTLANRDEMGFRMLLGRQAISGRFFVDVGKSFYGGQPNRKKRAKRK